MSLYLIGIGIEPKDLSLKALEALKLCEEVFLETYTSPFAFDAVQSLEKIIDKKIKILQRPELEENSHQIIDLAKNKNIAVLIPGDPLAATTHFQIVLEALNSKIKCEVIHAQSIFTLVARTGLQLYKFGKACSIPNFYSETPYFVLEQNLSIAAHTLFLIDLNLSLAQAIDLLLKLEEKFKKNIFTSSTLCLACSCLGRDKEKIVYGESEKIKNLNLEKPLSLIVPSDLHFLEAEALERFKIS